MSGRPPPAWTIIRLVAVLLVATNVARGQRVRFEVRGNESISVGDIEIVLEALRENIGERAPTDVDAEDAAHDVERYYASRGFPKATVSGRALRDRVIRLDVIERGRTWLGELRFHGATSIDHDDLSACFEWRLAGIIGFRQSVFTESAMSAGRDVVVSLYHLRGFLDVRVETRTRMRPGKGDDEVVDVDIDIDEGTRYAYTRPPAIHGAARFSTVEIIAALELELPVPANPRLALIWQGRIVDFYKNRGHYFATIDTDRRRNPDDGTVDVDYTIDEGPETRIRAIWVRGNERTRTSVILDRVHLRNGDRYSETRLRETHRSLLRSGLFSNVRIATLPAADTIGDAERDVVLRIDVTEKPGWELKFLVGYGSYELLRAGGSIENRNIFGLGHSLRTEGMISFKGERVSLSYRNPSFFYERLTHSAEGIYERRERPSFTRSEYGGSTGLRYLLTDDVSIDATHRLRQSNVGDVSSAIPDRFVRDVLLSSATISAIFDTRENLLDPGSGSTNKIAVEYSDELLGSELDFVRVTAATTWIWRVFDGVRLVTSAHGGVIDRFGRTDVVPIQERFFLGGENSIRSFLEDEAGPKIRDEPIGGETFVRFNAELRFPIWGALRGAVFYDLGNVTEDLDDFASDEYSSAIGAGLRYHTPIGPIRLDLGINPRRRAEEDLWALHFALGYPF